MTEKKTKKKEKKPLTVFTTGKRKMSVARALAVQGTGKIIINGIALENTDPEIARMYMSEPAIIAGDSAKAIDINVSVSGGGVMGQAEAVRQAVAKAMVAFDKTLKEKFLSYDRALLVADVRQNEPHKPSRSKAGPRRHKQRSKR